MKGMKNQIHLVEKDLKDALHIGSRVLVKLLSIDGFYFQYLFQVMLEIFRLAPWKS